MRSASSRDGSHHDFGWDQLNKWRFCFFTVINFTAMKAALYPLWLIKTRLQAQRGRNQYSGVFDACRKIVRLEGVRGLWRGFSVTAVGFIPAQLSYNFVYEWTRANLPYELARPDEHVKRNFYGGAAASFASSVVNVPLDVVTQRIMVQPADRPKYVSWKGLGVVWREEGFRGLYRGFGLSVMSYVPASAIWWSTYTAAHRQARASLPDPKLSWLVTGVCGAIAGFTSAALTNPLDVIKTRLQVLETANWNRATHGSRVLSVVKSLVAEEGLRGFSKGLGARLASSSVVSLMIITTYEGVKRLSRQRRDKQQHSPQPQYHLRHGHTQPTSTSTEDFAA